MTQVYCLAVAEKTDSTVRIMALEQDLSSFGMFQRSTVSEFIGFFAKTVIERTPLGERSSVEKKDLLCHVYIRTDGLACVMMTRASYPSRTAFSLLNRLADEFSTKFPQTSSWATMNPTTTSPKYPELKQHLANAQDPESTDPFMRVQKELDETKIVLHKTMESLLQRGENLNDLVAKADNLSGASKALFKTAQSTNSCCGI
ncbi:palmitoyltransferase [Thoreauomyces humboldtii]|nr:palmitoyltransferase [Thoreauomyces humboldtii]